MKRLIVAFASLLLLNLNADATGSTTANKTNVSAQAPAPVTANDNVAVYKETGFIHQLIFVDESNSGTPLTFSDYVSWAFIFGPIILLVAALLIVVKARDFITAVERKYGVNTHPRI